MNKAIALIPILAWTGVASYAGSARVDADAVGSRFAYADVVTVTPRLPEPVAVAPAARQQAVTPRINPADSVALSRALQGELKRVGCYDGQITSVWTPAARKAMRTFTERANAQLPVDKPDVVLLSLVQSHREVVCETDAVGVGDPPPKVAEKADAPGPALVPAAAAVSAVALRATQPDTKPLPKSKSEANMPPPTGDARTPSSVEPKPQRSVVHHQRGPVPPAGMHERRSRRSAKAPPDQPPKFMRSFIRSVKRTLAPLGLD
jgi:hypothetical protein